MDNLLGDSSGGGALPFFPGLPGSNPFDSNSNPMFPPMDNMMPGNKPSTDAPLDVDAIVRKIDEQIAKIEAEEKKLKENENNVNNTNTNVSMDSVINNKELQRENHELIEELFNNQASPSIENNATVEEKNNFPSNASNVTKLNDDDYFDDFWDE